VTNYRKQFDERLPQINAAIDSMSGSLESILPGFSKLRLKRFFQRFSLLFGRLDKNGARQGQFLAYPQTNVPDFIIANIDNAMNQMSGGASTFATNIFVTFVDLQEKLERAVGLDAATLSQISLAAAKDLSAVVSQADELLESSKIANMKIESLVSATAAQQASVHLSQQSTKADVDSIATFRAKVEQLLSKDGRQRASLESLVKRVQAHDVEVQQLRDSVDGKRVEIEAILAQSQEKMNAISGLQISLADSDEKAKLVLGLSAQAGLARSYLTESRKLETRANWFTAALYASVAITILLAACYVLPSLEKAINGPVGQESKLLVTLLRASILSPLVYVLYFTVKQISSLETLRMDYAEKAAASLAYSGYRDEMSADVSLLERLRGSLLLKFAEHPERLLRKSETRETISVTSPGFSATSSSGKAPEVTTVDE
jgi:hypothetical protein